MPGCPGNTHSHLIIKVEPFLLRKDNTYEIIKLFFMTKVKKTRSRLFTYLHDKKAEQFSIISLNDLSTWVLYFSIKGKGVT